MSSQPVWHSEIGFSDRLASIVSITKAYKNVHSTTDYTTAQSEAQRLEEEIFNSAASKEEYEQSCRETASKFEAQPPTETDEAFLNVGKTRSSGQINPDVDIGDVEGGEDIGRFKNASHHRDGLFSTVFKSKDEAGQLVALKVTTPHLMTAPHDSEREVRILAKAASPHIIPLLDNFRLPGGHLVLVFPFMPHGLDELFHQGSLATGQLISHLRDLFSALAHIHSLGIIHRDVKPSNIMLASPTGPAYLTDFGIAWWGEDRASEPDHMKITDVGTTAYRPPELLFGNTSYNYSLDLWAAGCVVAEAINMRHAQLFESGPLGSELSLIQSIFSTLGTPNEQTWPESEHLPDWGKMEFKQYSPKTWEAILPGASPPGRDLVSRLVRYESKERLSAEEVLQHPFFT